MNTKTKTYTYTRWERTETSPRITLCARCGLRFGGCGCGPVLPPTLGSIPWPFGLVLPTPTVQIVCEAPPRRKKRHGGRRRFRRRRSG